MKSHIANRRQEAEADARRGARRARARDGRASISPTADLFAETDASPASAPAPPSPALRPLKAGGVPPTTQTAGHTRPKQLWYAAVFPELVNMKHSAPVLRTLSRHPQQFTPSPTSQSPAA